MVGADRCGDDVGILTGDALVDWVTRSCLAQGIPVKVTDGRVLDRVRTLLGGKPGGPERGASTVGAPGARSEAPHGVDSIGIESGRSRRTREHGGVIQHGGDNGHLAGEIERAPLSA